MDRADELAIYKEAVSGLLERLSPRDRSRLLRKAAHLLRRSQQRRITAQVGPDGSPWPERKQRTDPKPASRAIRFLYRRPGADPRLVDMRSWTRRGNMLTGYDREAEGVRTFRADRISRHLPAAGSADPGALGGSIRGRRGGVKKKARAMFSRMRTASHLKAGATPDEAWVEFTSRASRIARVHHFGLKDRVAPGGPETRYPQRELLGFSQEDDEAVLALIVEEMER